MFYTIHNFQYLYKDQYGKHVFQSDSKDNNLLSQLCERIKKYESLNPIYLNNNALTIRFNDTKHLFKPRVVYDLIFCIHRIYNEKNKKTYINLHITDMQQVGKKEISKIKIEDV